MRVVATVAANENVAVQEAAHDLHTETARQVVVTGSGLAQLGRPGALAQRSDGPWWRQSDEVLEKRADLGTRQSVVTVSAVRFDGEQAGGGQLAQVATGRRPADPRLVGEHAGR